MGHLNLCTALVLKNQDKQLAITQDKMEMGLLKPYTTMVEEETRKKFEEYQEFYRKINDYNKDNRDNKDSKNNKD